MASRKITYKLILPFMKTVAAFVSLTFALLASASADSSAKITDVHLCCKSCATGVEKAIGSVPGAKAAVYQDAGTVAFSGPGARTVQQGAQLFGCVGEFC